MNDENNNSFGQIRTLKEYRERVKESGEEFPVSIAVSIVAQIALLEGAEEKLATAHKISSEQVLVSDRGKVGLGEAPFTRTGARSPRKSEGRSFQQKLGSLLWELLTDQAFLERSQSEHQMPVLAPSEFNSKVTESLDAIVVKALADQAEDQYKSAALLEAALSDFMVRENPYFDTDDISKSITAFFKPEPILREDEPTRLIPMPGSSEWLAPEDATRQIQSFEAVVSSSLAEKPYGDEPYAKEPSLSIYSFNEEPAAKETSVQPTVDTIHEPVVEAAEQAAEQVPDQMTVASKLEEAVPLLTEPVREAASENQAVKADEARSQSSFEEPVEPSVISAAASPKNKGQSRKPVRESANVAAVKTFDDPEEKYHYDVEYIPERTWRDALLEKITLERAGVFAFYVLSLIVIRMDQKQVILDAIFGKRDNPVQSQVAVNNPVQNTAPLPLAANNEISTPTPAPSAAPSAISQVPVQALPETAHPNPVVDPQAALAETARIIKAEMKSIEEPDEADSEAEEPAAKTLPVAHAHPTKLKSNRLATKRVPPKRVPAQARIENFNYLRIRLNYQRGPKPLAIYVNNVKLDMRKPITKILPDRQNLIVVQRKNAKPLQKQLQISSRKHASGSTYDLDLFLN